jgi:hypothetical protein
MAYDKCKTGILPQASKTGRIVYYVIWRGVSLGEEHRLGVGDC